MAKRTGRQKVERVLWFLLGFRNPRVTALMATRGMVATDVEEGWRLLRELGAPGVFPPPLGAPPRAPLTTRAFDARLATWQRRWLPITKATLERAHPRVAEGLVRDIGSERGIRRVFAMSILAERFERLLASTDGEDRAAVALLAERGVTAEVIASLQAILAELRQFPDTTQAFEPDHAALAAAEAALWAWYLEWSRIARAVIHDRALLRELGFLPAAPRNARQTAAAT